MRKAIAESTEDGLIATLAPVSPTVPRVAFPRRWALAWLLFLCNACMYLCRANASDAVLKMFPADKSTQSIVLTAFYGGYMCQFMYSPLVERFGAKAVLGSAVASYAILTLMLVPLGTSVIAATTLRVLIGVFQGASYVTQCSLAAYWYPQLEFNRAWTLSASGESIGTIAMLGLGPILEQQFSWHSIFWSSGFIALAWSCMFSLLASSKPECTSCKISAVERDYIVAARRPIENEIEVPWRRILCCRPFWALVATHVCYNYGYYVALGWLPSYFADPPFNAKFSEMGLLSLLPYIMLFFLGTLSGIFADWLLRRGFTVLVVRKITNTIGFIGPAIFFFLLRFCRTHGSIYLASVFSAMAVGLGGFGFAGYWANFTDLSPRFGCHLIAISNSVASLPGIVGNLLTGLILSGNSNDYDKVFDVACGVYIVGALIFLMFADAKPQF